MRYWYTTFSCMDGYVTDASQDLPSVAAVELGIRVQPMVNCLLMGLLFTIQLAMKQILISGH